MGISWDVMLKMTRIELELILDIGMHLFIEKGGEVFLTLLKDVVKQIINTCNHIMLMNQVNVLCILVQIIYMVGQ